jgi:hypothetical protein
MSKPKWDVRNEGRPWTKDEAWQRFELLPEKNELFFGELSWTEEERENVLGLILELVGADRAAQFGNPEVWRAAVAKLQK